MSKSQQQRTPKGAVIPIPKRDDFLSNLGKVVAPEKKSKNRRASKKR
jgi:hypothetical protein